jgi:tetratricopeptide (TPR) repeat protein
MRAGAADDAAGSGNGPARGLGVPGARACTLATDMTRALAVLAVLAAFTALLLAMFAHAGVPPVLVPQHADSVGVGEAPAPFIIPGQANPADSLRPTPERLAREQFALGQELERENHPAAAIAAYRNAIRFLPSIPEAHYRMGMLLAAAGQHSVAAKQFEAELVRQPEHRDAGRALALERAQLGDTTAAIGRLERLTRANPADEASWQALGFAYSTAGRPLEGERALRRALALNPKDADAWRDLGAVLAALKRDREAREAYAHATKLAPRDPSAWINLGNLERRMGRTDAALTAYGEAIRRDSSAALAWRGRIAVLDALGHPLEVAETFRAWLAFQPEDNSLRVETMERYDALGRKDIALELARDGVRRAPKAGAARLALGMALHEAGDERAALLEMRRAQSLLRKPGQGERIGALIAGMRSRAPDSLRALFAADSSANENPAAATDSSRSRPAR